MGDIFHPLRGLRVCVRVMYVGTSPYAMVCRLVEAFIICCFQIYDVFWKNDHHTQPQRGEIP